MSRRPLVSIIVPVYNVEAYLRQCFDSLVAQTYENIEIVLVDDGSTDGSGALCDRLVAETSRLAFVLHKKNEGLSVARNDGLAVSHGEWIAFVDSDDWVSPLFIEVMVSAANRTGCEIVAVPFGTPFNDGETCQLVEHTKNVPEPIILSGVEAQRRTLYQKLETGAQWHFFKKTILGNAPFPEGLIFEDLASVYALIHKVETIAVIETRSLYAYRVRMGSIIRQAYKHQKGVSAVVVANQLYQDICEWYPSLKAAAASRAFSLCRMVFSQIPARTKSGVGFAKDRNDIWLIIKKHRHTVLWDSQARKRERLAAGAAHFGMNAFYAFCQVCRYFGKMK